MPAAWQTSIDISGMNDIIRKMEMADEDVKNATASTLKRMRSPFTKQIAKIACDRYNIDSSTINRKLAQHVNASNETLNIFISGVPLNLMSFNGTTPNEPPAIVRDTTRPKQHTNIKGVFITAHPQKPYNIDVEIIKGKRKTLSFENTNYPFIMKTGAESVGKMPFFIARNPIKNDKRKEKGVKGVTTLSIPQMFTNEEVEGKIQEKGKEIFLKQFEQAMKQIDATNKILGG